MQVELDHQLMLDERDTLAHKLDECQRRCSSIEDECRSLQETVRLVVVVRVRRSRLFLFAEIPQRKRTERCSWNDPSSISMRSRSSWSDVLYARVTGWLRCVSQRRQSIQLDRSGWRTRRLSHGWWRWWSGNITDAEFVPDQREMSPRWTSPDRRGKAKQVSHERREHLVSLVVQTWNRSGL